MLINTDAAINEAATNHPDLDFRCLLSRLLAAISCDGEFDPTELVRLVIIEPSDTLESTMRYSRLANDTLMQAVEAGAAKMNVNWAGTGGDDNGV